jgi:hypothetical protein
MISNLFALESYFLTLQSAEGESTRRIYLIAGKTPHSAALRMGMKGGQLRSVNTDAIDK